MDLDTQNGFTGTALARPSRPNLRTLIGRLSRRPSCGRHMVVAAPTIRTERAESVDNMAGLQRATPASRAAT